MTKQQVVAKTDTRETPEIAINLAEQFMNHSDVEYWIEEHLPAADIEIEGIGFERKTPGDFASSLTSGRLHEQIEKLDQRYEYAYILVEGDLSTFSNPYHLGSGVSDTAVRGAMASSTARHGFPVMCCSNLALLADMAVRLARKHLEEEQTSRLPTGDIDDNDAPTPMKMYGCIPDIGPKTAQTLYDEYPSITDFMRDADNESLQDLDGIGEKTASQVMGAFL